MINGTSSSDTIAITGLGPTLTVVVNSVSTNYSLTETSTITVNSGSGTDTIAIAVASKAQIEGDFDNGDNLTVGRGYVFLDSARHLGTVALPTFGGFLTMTSTSECLYLDSLTIGGGVLDLKTNDLVVNYTSASPFNTILNYVNTGYSPSPDIDAPFIAVVATDQGGDAARNLVYNEVSERWEWDHPEQETQSMIYKDEGNDNWVLVWDDDVDYAYQYYTAPLTGNDHPPLDPNTWTFWKAERYAADGAELQTGVILSLTPDPGWGIISTDGRNSTAPAGQLLALFDNASGNAGFTEWPIGSNVSVSANSVIGKYTFNGDADLNGLVDGDDYWVLDSYQFDTNIPAGSRWLRGDLDRDGAVDEDDYDIVAANIGLP